MVLDPDKTGTYSFTTAPVAEIGSQRSDKTAYRSRTMFSHQFVLAEGKVYDAMYAALNGVNGKPGQSVIAGWTLNAYLGRPPGKDGLFVVGAGEEGKKRAFFNIGYGEVRLVTETRSAMP